MIFMVLPWDTGEHYHFLPPMLTYALIHYWTVKTPRDMPVLFVFIVGLATDIIKGGPLGYWALLYLSGVLTALILAARFGSATAGLTVSMLASGVTIAVTGWVVASLYYFRIVDVVAILNGIGVAFLLFGLALIVVGWQQKSSRRLFRSRN